MPGILTPGRPRLPTALKEARGTLRPSRENPSEVRTEHVTIPDAPPEELGLSPREARSWMRCARAVNALRCAGEADMLMFEQMVYAHARAVKLRRAKNTYAWSAAVKAFAALAVQFGLTPSMRAKVLPLSEAKAADDPLEEFDA